MSKTTISAFGSDKAGTPADPGDDFTLIISGFRLEIDSLENEKDLDEIKKEFDLISEEIWIDKTYVDFKENKYEFVFLREDGWNELKRFIWKIYDNYSIETHMIIRKTLESIIISYMEHMAVQLGYDPELLYFSVDPDSDINIRLIKDTAKEWLTYPGRWQDWPENN